MKTIGIKLADGSFYPVLQEGTKEEKQLDLTTAHNNQTRVMVDMYRSKTCSIEDAEYVDTLQIDNLIAHPNGEANISFTVSLDEENNLFAKIVDSETGAQSKTTITLVSRTLEERLVPDSYEIKETPTIEAALDETKEEKPDVKKAVVAAAAGGGLLAAAMKLNKELSKKDEEVAADPVEEPSDEEIDVIEEDPTIADTIEETAIDESELMDSFENTDTTPELEIEIPETNEAENFNFDDLDLGEIPVEDAAVEEPVAEENLAEDFSLPDMEDPVVEATEESDAEDSILEETPVTDSVAEEMPVDDFNLDDFNMDETPVEDAAVEESVVEEPVTEAADETDIFSMDDLDLGDTTSEEPVTEAADETDIFNMDDLDLGDTSSEETAPDDTDIFDDDFDNLSLEDGTTESSLPDFSDFDDFTTDLDERAENADLFSTDDMEDLGSMGSTLVAADPFNFEGLYDENPSLDSIENDEEEEEIVIKKTKVPVIICIICAIICIIATALVLFVIPSKYNLFGKNKNIEKEVVVDSVEEEIFTEPEEAPEEFTIPEPEPVYEEPEEEVPQAKENEVVIIEEAEKVVPVVPEVVEEKPADISYKIKWGDTLWDIADTYYKNPWRYKAIARYNGIKNPDYIISGTIIAIPAE